MLQSFKDWLAKPFSEDQSAKGWFLFVGLLIVSAIGWHMILNVATSRRI